MTIKHTDPVRMLSVVHQITKSLWVVFRNCVSLPRSLLLRKMDKFVCPKRPLAWQINCFINTRQCAWLSRKTFTRMASRCEVLEAAVFLFIYLRHKPAIYHRIPPNRYSATLMVLFSAKPRLVLRISSTFSTVRPTFAVLPFFLVWILIWW